MKIIIEEYNPDWIDTYQIEKSLLQNSLKEVHPVIEHIGSTSVEGLAAKPIIDILIGIGKFEQANDQIHRIEKLGYKYIQTYEDTMPYRRFFIKDQNVARTHHIHMVETGTEFWTRHLKFRDHLRINQNDRDAYSILKKELTKKEWADGNEYAAAKSDFIKSIERK